MKQKICCSLLAICLIFSGMPIAASAGWKQCWRYSDENGVYLKNQWKQLNGSWYYFDDDGLMKTGWIAAGGRWYHCAESGKMQTGWIALEDGTYYLAESGAMVTGACKIDGKACVFSNSGRLVTGNADDWNLRLVNPQNPLPDDFSIDTATVNGYRFDARAAEALSLMLQNAKEDGCPLQFISGYRTISYQKNLYQNSVRDRMNRGMSRLEAEAETALYVAKPGYSEHNLGLAADIVSADWYQSHSGLYESFDQTDAFSWLSEHAWEYGFILRYPKEAAAVTGIAYEPWHYRYVGIEAAKIIRGEDLTLEAYHEKYLIQ